MSGVPTPVYPIVRPFGNSLLAPTAPGGATLPIPVESQVDVLIGAASFEDGFPGATMVDPEAGGIAPYGQDFNGIGFMLSAYLAMIQAGQWTTFNPEAVDFFEGYRVGARLESTVTLGLFWTNLVDGNIADPDVDPTGWYASEALHDTVAPTAGTHNDYALPGGSDYALDIDSAAGNIDFGGFVAQRDGQVLYLSNTGANLVQVLANAGGSAADNRVRSATDLAIIQNQTLTLKWFAGLNRWLLV